MKRRLLLGFVILVTLLALFYAEEDWRGARAWATLKAQLEARGELFDIKAFIPPSVPDDQNFCTTPLLANLALTKYDTVSKLTVPDNAKARQTLYEMGLSDSKATKPKPSYMMPTDFSAWREYYLSDPDFAQAHPLVSGTDAVLLHFSEHATEWNELENAAKRRYAHFPLDYHIEPGVMIDTDHLDGTLDLVRVLAVKVSAEMLSGHTQEGMATLRIFFKLRQAVGEEPRLLTLMLDTTITTLALESIKTSLSTHSLKQGDLKLLSLQLEQIDLLREFSISMGSETRFLYVRSLDYVKTDGFRALMRIQRMGYRNDPNLVTKLKLFALSLMPSGWYDLNKFYGVSYMQKYSLASIDPATHRFYYEKLHAAGYLPIRKTPIFSLTSIFAEPFGYYCGGNAEFAALIQTYVDMTRIACALEAYYLDNHQYPESLEMLSEKLPCDVMSGEPYHYERTADGRFRLWSVGPNKINDRDKWTFEKKHPDRLDNTADDNVWSYAP